MPAVRRARVTLRSKRGSVWSGRAAWLQRFLRDRILLDDAMERVFKAAADGGEAQRAVFDAVLSGILQARTDKICREVEILIQDLGKDRVLPAYTALRYGLTGVGVEKDLVREMTRVGMSELGREICAAIEMLKEGHVKLDPSRVPDDLVSSLASFLVELSAALLSDDEYAERYVGVAYAIYLASRSSHLIGLGDRVLGNIAALVSPEGVLSQMESMFTPRHRVSDPQYVSVVANLMVMDAMEGVPDKLELTPLLAFFLHMSARCAAKDLPRVPRGDRETMMTLFRNNLVNAVVAYNLCLYYSMALAGMISGGVEDAVLEVVDAIATRMWGSPGNRRFDPIPYPTQVGDDGKSVVENPIFDAFVRTTGIDATPWGGRKVVLDITKDDFSDVARRLFVPLEGSYSIVRRSRPVLDEIGLTAKLASILAEEIPTAVAGPEVSRSTIRAIRKHFELMFLAAYQTYAKLYGIDDSEFLIEGVEDIDPDEAREVISLTRGESLDIEAIVRGLLGTSDAAYGIVEMYSDYLEKQGFVRIDPDHLARTIVAYSSEYAKKIARNISEFAELSGELIDAMTDLRVRLLTASSALFFVFDRGVADYILQVGGMISPDEIASKADLRSNIDELVKSLAKVKTEFTPAEVEALKRVSATHVQRLVGERPLGELAKVYDSMASELRRYFEPIGREFRDPLVKRIIDTVMSAPRLSDLIRMWDRLEKPEQTVRHIMSAITTLYTLRMIREFVLDAARLEKRERKAPPAKGVESTMGEEFVKWFSTELDLENACRKKRGMDTISTGEAASVLIRYLTPPEEASLPGRADYVRERLTEIARGFSIPGWCRQWGGFDPYLRRKGLDDVADYVVSVLPGKDDVTFMNIVDSELKRKLVRMGGRL